MVKQLKGDLILNNTKRGKSQVGVCLFPEYKWCGPGCSGPGTPINDVDACCQSHDKCLKFNSQCYCDKKFRKCLRPKVNLSSEKGRVAALMYTYMSFQTIFTCWNRD
jgi:hypothetical protein